MPDQAAEGVLSPWLRRQRFQVCRAFLKGKVLDFGCGSGALAAHLPSDQYVGVDHDGESLALARRRYPGHRFVRDVPLDETFDTIALLAVIEHLSDPGSRLTRFASLLNPGGNLVLTTPHPRGHFVHEVAARLGIASREAHEDHEELFDRASFERITGDIGLDLVLYRPFLFGLNQLFLCGVSE
jgi:2-polyprenyl-3-methyl-5-hydroxy-6-metoxy-1,4-benzoquinol methylase